MMLKTQYSACELIKNRCEAELVREVGLKVQGPGPSYAIHKDCKNSLAATPPHARL